MSLVPVVDLEVVGRRPALAGLCQLPKTQKERCPLHAAMGGEFDGFAPVPVAEHQDRVVALPGDVKSRLGADPFRRTVLESPMHRRARVHLRDIEIHPADLFAGLISKADDHRAPRTRRAGRVLGPPARHAFYGRYGLDDFRDRRLDANSVNDVHHDPGSPLVLSLAVHTSALEVPGSPAATRYYACGPRTESDKCDGIPVDSLITAAARALVAGDPLGALKRVALRDDAPALALRGVAMAQLGELVRAKALLRSAARAFGPKEAVARARCVVAEAEIALVSRDLGWPAKALDAARARLEAHGDRVNAAHAQTLAMRRLLLIGRLDEAEQALAGIDPAPLPPALKAAHELVVAGIAMRRLRTGLARAALARAERAARQAGIPALLAEVDSASRVLDTPAARLIARGEERPLRLEDVEAVLASRRLVVDACRHVVRDKRSVVSLARRPVLFALARALGEAWPGDVPRGTLLARAFRAKHADESHRARLRVEIGRLRRELRMLAGVNATQHGFTLEPRRATDVVVLARPVEERHAAVLAFLADGESWSSSALALALG